MRHRTYGTIERKAGAPMRIVAANEGKQADGIDLRMIGADLGRYLANPVIGYGHEYWGRNQLPIGRAATTTVEGAQLLVEPEFDQDDEFAVEVERKLRAGYLNAVSIGFDVHDLGEDGVPARWELFEVSVVPLPMDPAALVAARGAAESSPCPQCVAKHEADRADFRQRSQLARARHRVRQPLGGAR
jgi:hypothetical protein